jgi:acetyltransferase-like isoleucine patch superfamily enzyme
MSTDNDSIKHRFKACGQNVDIAPDAIIEHPEAIEVGDNVRIMRNFQWMGKAEICRIGSNVTFYPNCFIQGDPGRFVIDDDVTFFPNQYLSLGGWKSSFVEIGRHSHFAPNCVLYGWGGLNIGRYCNIAAHTVFATVGHHDEITDRPMALTGEKAGPITLEEDVWVCANVTITANVTIAKGCVVGANAVVTRDTQPMGVYVGVPARRFRDR